MGVNLVLTMKKLTYTEIQGIFERLFFSPIIGVKPIGKEYKVMFSKLSEERVLALHNLAQSCKRLENSYNKSANKFYWWLKHAIQYKDYRSSVIQIISYYYPNINKDSFKQQDCHFKKNIQML